MKHAAIPAVLAAVLLGGCVYEAPLTTDHGIAVDSSVIGLWEAVPDAGREPDPDERMLILKYSETEYLIHYDDLYYRAWAINIGGVSGVQIQVIGTRDGALKPDDKELYHVASYHLLDDKLEIRWLNTDLINDDLKTSAELREAFLRRRDDRNLFDDPGVFRRVGS